MAWRIYEIKKIFLIIKGIMHGDSLSLYSNTSLSLNFKFIKKLIRAIFGYSIGNFKQSISKSRFTMINMCNNTKISNSLRWKILSFIKS